MRGGLLLLLLGGPGGRASVEGGDSCGEKRLSCWDRVCGMRLLLIFCAEN